ncbi:MAG: adenylate/guanylate cyclase domain-containing protein [Rhodothermales bacterium]
MSEETTPDTAAPPADDQQAAPAEEAAHAEKTARPEALVLVVDDEPDLAALIRQKFRRRIRKGELDFLFAGDGHEALDQLRSHPDVDLVLTDINMPRMDGLTLLAELTRLGGGEGQPGAVVVTAYGDMMNIRTAMNRGAFDFLTKPIDLDDLEVTLDKALERVGERKQAAHARETVGRYLSDEVAETLLAGPEATELGGERRRVTILMSDLRGFSALSERLAPERVVDVLNIHLGVMAGVIAEYGGTIDEYIGDGILVLFGAPVAREDHARRAVACAIAMQLAMDEVNERAAAMGLPRLQMGIGINTGDVVVGNIGSEKRMKYGVVGSPVNETGRIESATVGGQILVSESTLSEAGPDVKVRRALHLGAKGFADPIPLFEIEGIGGPVGLALPEQNHALQPLARPLPVRFYVLDGKRLGDDAVDADFVALSEAGGLLRTDRPLDPFADLKLHVPLPDASAQGHAYAKVLEASDDGYAVHFTAMADDVADVLRSCARREAS